ncbi:MAG: DJ-1/PfpI family protein [Pseudomonadota bacterium]
MREIGAVVFPGFELLDYFGPLELFGMHKDQFSQVVLAEAAGPIASAQGPRVAVDRTLAETERTDILLVPGGPGTRYEVENPELLGHLARLAETAEIVASVCTGSALLAKAGLLDGRRATSNKLAFDWVAAFGPHVIWQRRARWVEDGRFVTASGVSAGMDMSLAVIARLLGAKAAEDAAHWAEYTAHWDPDDDPFAVPSPSAKI